MDNKLESRRFEEGTYLTSEDVIKLTGVTRRMLSTVEKKELCTPHRESSYGGVLGWTPEQARLIEQIDLLRKGGVSFDEIDQIVNGEHASVDLTSVETYLELLRKSRRALKRAVSRQYRMADFEKCGIREGYYLRYFPQRYFALIPQSYTSLMNAKSRMRATMALMSVIDHVGWTRTESIGGILGAPQPYEASCFACVELSSMPSPSAADSDDPDSGCYHNYGGDCALGVEGACAHCARFGSTIDPSESLVLSQVEASAPAKPVRIMVDELERPYACGPWSSFTNRHLRANGKRDEAVEQQVGAAGRSGDAPELSPAARPQLMPQLVELPLGITACVVPAGYYLCRQCQDGEQLQCLSEMIGTTLVIPQRERTLDIERKVSGLLAAVVCNTTGSVPGNLSAENSDMRAGMDPIGDPSQRGRCRDVDYSELTKLTIPSAMGLTPESDFPLLWTTVPCVDADAKPVYELQAPVSIGDIELGKRAERLRPDVLGIVAPAPRIEKGESLHSFRCRFCGSSLQPYEDTSVLICDNCGSAQPQMNVTNDRRMLLLQQAEDLRAQGNFDAGEMNSLLARDLDPSDAEAHWLLMLCRYGVSYRKDPSCGRYVPHMARPSEDPLELDEDCAAALALADDAQWIIYKRQLSALEAARVQALEEGQEPA